VFIFAGTNIIKHSVRRTFKLIGMAGKIQWIQMVWSNFV